jgi:hypothetical protein
LPLTAWSGGCGWARRFVVFRRAQALSNFGGDVGAYFGIVLQRAFGVCVYARQQ